MKAEFAGDATAGELTISIDPQTRAIEIKKSAFPFAVCIALPNFKGAANNVKYSVCNPEQWPGTGPEPDETIPSRFEVVGEDVELQLNGQMYKLPEDAARFLIQKLFTI